MKIVTVIGARPQFIKAATLSKAIQSIKKKKKTIKEILIHTGQHYDYLMDKIFFEELRLPKPNYHLDVGSASHGKQTALMLERVEKVLIRERPDIVIVYGDTNSTLAGALGAAKLNIPIAHIEAGLRSYNRSMPEEINRVVTDHISNFLFCPTKRAVKNLEKEGIKNGEKRLVKNVGDVMYDSILYYSQIAEKKSTVLKDLNLIHPFSSHKRDYYLATIHRAENTDNPKRLKSILKALNEIGREIPVVLPLHPRTKKKINIYQFDKEIVNVKVIEPVSYLNMLILEKYAKLILTDSGGVQKEAFWFRVPCVTLRDETEWIETVKSGWNILVGSKTKKIVEGVKSIEKMKPQKGRITLFGDGKASEKIVQILINAF